MHISIDTCTVLFSLQYFDYPIKPENILLLLEVVVVVVNDQAKGYSIPIL